MCRARHGVSSMPVTVCHCGARSPSRPLSRTGSYGINCSVSNIIVPGVAGTMARFAGTGVAAVVDTLGREGLTLLAAALFALTAFASLRRRS